MNNNITVTLADKTGKKNNVKVNITNDLSFTDMVYMINQIVESSFVDDVYKPWNRDLFTHLYILNYFTDINLDKYLVINDDKTFDIDKAYKFLTSAGVCDVCSLVAETTDYINIKEYVEIAIEDKKKEILQKTPKVTDIAMAELLNLITNVVNKLDENSLNKDDLNKVLNAKDDIVKALIDNADKSKSKVDDKNEF